MSKQTQCLIYIGDDFYRRSGTVMSSLYTEDGRRSDWGLVQTALRDGASVLIRQATEAERAPYVARLVEMERKERGA